MSLHRRAGSLARNGYALELTPEDAGWGYSSLRIVELAPGESHTLATGDDEVAVLSLAGSAEVEVGGTAFRLAGRSSVFAAVSDFVYAPPAATVTLASERGGRFALPGARAEDALPARHVPAGDIPVEFRGAGICSRQIVNFCTPDAFEAQRLIACEVLTPAGNWSSFPPHKHDEEREGETSLEEIYYFEVADGPDGPGVGYQRVYGTAERPIDVLAEVRSGDVVLVPHGWHGPAMAMPGYDLYYLNVMAGPGERAWRISVDPVHEWIRAAWEGEPVDSRLPLTRAEA
jgi:5-deoxy-glucuronate isomerase